MMKGFRSDILFVKSLYLIMIFVAWNLKLNVYFQDIDPNSAFVSVIAKKHKLQNEIEIKDAPNQKFSKFPKVIILVNI